MIKIGVFYQNTWVVAQPKCFDKKVAVFTHFERDRQIDREKESEREREKKLQCFLTHGKELMEGNFQLNWYKKELILKG